MEKNDPTNGEILAAIENCEWLSENRRVISDPFSGICTGLLLPCSKAIDDGKCPTLRKLFGTEPTFEEIVTGALEK